MSCTYASFGRRFTMTFWAINTLKSFLHVVVSNHVFCSRKHIQSKSENMNFSPLADPFLYNFMPWQSSMHQFGLGAVIWVHISKHVAMNSWMKNLSIHQHFINLENICSFGRWLKTWKRYPPWNSHFSPLRVAGSRGFSSSIGGTCDGYQEGIKPDVTDLVRQLTWKQTRRLGFSEKMSRYGCHRSSCWWKTSRITSWGW